LTVAPLSPSTPRRPIVSLSGKPMQLSHRMMSHAAIGL